MTSHQFPVVPQTPSYPPATSQPDGVNRAKGITTSIKVESINTEALKELIGKLYLVNMNYRNETKFCTRLTNSTKGQLRWYTHEISAAPKAVSDQDGDEEGKYIRRSPKADALWKILGDHITFLCKPDNMILPVSCPEGIDMQLWFHIEKRVSALVFFMRGRSDTEKTMVDLAKQLPFADWVQSKACPGFSLVNYAKLIGTVRNLADYRSPGAVWKMVGLAPFKKGDVTKSCSTWMYEGGLTSEDWVKAAYSPSRRSMMYVIGDCLIKAGGGIKRPEKWNRYSRIYYERKEYEKVKAPLLKPIIHHRRAQRVMEKRLVRDLWVMWRDLIRPQMAIPVAA